MAEEITQKLGFDASKAIASLNNLNTSLRELKTTLESVGTVATGFAAKTQPMTAALNNLKTAANGAKTALSGLGGAPVAATASIGATSAAVGTFTQNAQGALGTSTQLAGAFTTTAQAAQQVSTTSGAAAGALEDVGKKGKKAGTDINLAWKTVARVVQAQIIVRSIQRIIAAFGESQKAAADFSVAVAEAFTISGSQLGTIEQMNQSVLDLANNLGLTAAEVAEGTYQTLSNQVVDAGDSLKFASEAAKLSIATHSDLKTAVNALSSVMNSYNLDVSETERVSNTLFKTIEKGRLRLDEFGSVLGRLSPLTAELGISYEEMAASIAALTQKGVPAHTAITQLTQVSQKLLRPTEGLKTLYEEWMGPGGSGPEAIKRFGGLTGVLLKMKDATAGNDVAFANLLGRVRSIVGALNLTSNEAGAVVDALDAIQGAAGATAKAYNEVNDSIGRKAIASWNRLGNTLIEFGTTFLGITTPLSNALNVLLGSTSSLTTVLATAAGALVIYKAGAIAATVSTLSFTASLAALRASLTTLAPVILALAAAMAGAAIGKFVADSLDKATEASARAATLQEELTKKHDEQSQKRVQATRREFNELRQITEAGFAAMSKEYTKDLDTLRAGSAGIGAVLDRTLTDLLGKRDKAIKAMRDAVLDADDAIKDSLEIVKDTQNAISEEAFRRDQRNLGKQGKLWAQIERAQRSAAEAREAYASAGADEAKIEAARELSDIAEKRAQETISNAEQAKSIGTRRKAEEALDDILGDRIRGEISYQLERKDLQTETHKSELDNLEQQGVKLKELLELVREMSDPLTSKGILKSLSARKADAERIAELTIEIGEQMDRAFDFDMFEKLGLSEGLDKVRDSIGPAFDDAKFNWDKAVGELARSVESRTYNASIKLEIENEYIIEEFVKRFGEMDVLGDPGMIGSKMQTVLEDTVSKYEELNATITSETETALNQVDAALARLTKDEWFTWLDRLKESSAEALTEFGDAQARAAGVTESVTAGLEKQASASEQLRTKLLAAGTTLREAIVDQRALTKAEGEAINETLALGSKMQETGELSRNAGNQGVAAFKELVTSVTALQQAVAALNEQNEITPGAYEDAVVALGNVKQKQVETLAAQKANTAEAGETKGELDKAKDSQAAMPAVATQATSAISAEADQAGRLKTNLEGAEAAQKRLAVAPVMTAGAPGGAGPAAAPADLPSAEEVALITAAIAGATDAVKTLSTALAGVDTKVDAIGASFKTVGEGITKATTGAITLTTTFAEVGESAGKIYNVWNKIVGRLASSVRNMRLYRDGVLSATKATQAADDSTSSWNTSLQQCVQSGQQLAVAMRSAAAASLQAAAAARQAAAACAAASAQCSGGGVTAAKGGRFFAKGGRGTDTVPAMLTPGEFVMNKRSAGKFYPQLQAMNAGMSPNFRSEGGSVTNVGDINVTVSGGGESHAQTAREIAFGLRRELRRKTITL